MSNVTQQATFTASLPMYDWPELASSNDQFWTLLKESLQDQGLSSLPNTLSRTDLMRQWRDPLTVLSQTCGFPLKQELGDSVHILGTPCYNAQYCNNGYYASTILVSRESEKQSLSNFRHLTLVINSTDSQSGCNALRNLLSRERLLSEQPYFKHTIISGSHRNSILAIATGKADLCAIDPVAWQLAQRYDSAAQEVRVLCDTGYTPALPLICSRSVAEHYKGSFGNGPDAMSSAVKTGWIDALSQDPTLADTLLLTGITSIPAKEYYAVPILKRTI